MHPPLTPANHPLCGDVIAALRACHAANPWAKLAGACNEPKWALDACFKDEARAWLRARLRRLRNLCAHGLRTIRARPQQKQVKRKANFELAQQERARYAQRLAQRAEAAAAADS
jgi:COX assembly protein 2